MWRIFNPLLKNKSYHRNYYLSNKTNYYLINNYIIQNSLFYSINLKFFLNIVWIIINKFNKSLIIQNLIKKNEKNEKNEKKG